MWPRRQYPRVYCYMSQEIEHAQRDLDSVNAQIRAKTEELTKKYAPSGKWEITPLFGWTKKGATP